MSREGTKEMWQAVLCMPPDADDWAEGAGFRLEALCNPPLPTQVVAASLARPFKEAARLARDRMLVVQDPAAVPPPPTTLKSARVVY